MYKQAAPTILDDFLYDSLEAELTGRLTHIETAENSTRITLIDCNLTLREFPKAFTQDIDREGVEELLRKQIEVKKVIVYISSVQSLKLGYQVSVAGKAESFKEPTNPGQFDEYQYYKSQNFSFKMYGKTIKVLKKSDSVFLQSLYYIKTKYLQTYANLLPERDAGILGAMILNEKSVLDPQTKELYQVNGISHILAISGLHITLIGLTLYKILRKIGMPTILTSVICCISLYSYGVLTNFSVSTNRAVAMFVIFMAAGVVGRTYDMLSATALSGLVILLQSPMELFNAGFLLSFGAIMGISLVYPILKKAISVQHKLMDSFLICVSIQLVTTPTLLYFFYEIPTYSILINMLILPLSSFIILLAVTAGTFGLFLFPIGTFLAGGVHYTLVFYEFVCKTALYLPGRTITTGRPDGLFIILYYGILITFVAINQKKVYRKKLFVLLLLCVILIKPYDKSLRITFLDVGQGDGIVMVTPNKTTFLIDGGSSDEKKVGKYRIIPYFKQLGIKQIDYAIVTHGDSDHISGVKELMESMKSEHSYSVKGSEENTEYVNYITIQNLVLPDLKEMDEAMFKLQELAEQKGINVLYITKGDKIQDGEVAITCLHPTDVSNGGNSSSIVLSITFKEFDLLLTGDLEGEGEKAVTSELSDILSQTSIYLEEAAVDYDVLKVAHHGSKNSTHKEFLQLVKPELSIISCGRGNRYGHPHDALLKRLEAIESEILITYREGAITIITDGLYLKVKTFLSKD
ncbi:competence protein ComEC [Anaerocolumna cellulosilytica]|nr:competence protein ComEC [Anaerocolumna cellulosilytica]